MVPKRTLWNLNLKNGYENKVEFQEVIKKKTCRISRGLGFSP